MTASFIERRVLKDSASRQARNRVAGRGCKGRRRIRGRISLAPRPLMATPSTSNLSPPSERPNEGLDWKKEGCFHFHAESKLTLLGLLLRPASGRLDSLPEPCPRSFYSRVGMAANGVARRDLIFDLYAPWIRTVGLPGYPSWLQGQAPVLDRGALAPRCSPARDRTFLPEL